MKKLLLLLASMAIFGCANHQPNKGYTDLAWLKESILIDASNEQVWEIIATNFDENSKHIPRIKRSFYKLDLENKIGSIRRSEYHDGEYLDVKITHYQPNTYIQWEMTDTSIGMLKKGVGAYTLIQEEQGIRLIQDAGYRSALPIADGVIAGRFKTMFRTILAGIKYQAETGRKLSRGQEKVLLEKYKSYMRSET